MTGMVLVMPLVIALSSVLFLLLPASLKHRVRPGAEALLMMPIIVAVVWGCLETNAWWEFFLFDGHFKPWLQTHLGLNYDQRNAIVVGVAMDTMSQIESHLLTRHYEGFTKKRMSRVRR